jgi:hypothetical protein
MSDFANEPTQDTEENDAQQGEPRNDVVVKIGLVGDAQVTRLSIPLLKYFKLKITVFYCAGWENNADGKVRRK